MNQVSLVEVIALVTFLNSSDLVNNGLKISVNIMMYIYAPPTGKDSSNNLDWGLL